MQECRGLNSYLKLEWQNLIFQKFGGQNIAKSEFMNCKSLFNRKRGALCAFDNALNVLNVVKDRRLINGALCQTPRQVNNCKKSGGKLALKNSFWQNKIFLWNILSLAYLMSSLWMYLLTFPFQFPVLKVFFL